MQVKNREVIQLVRQMNDDYSYNEAIKTLRTNIQFCGSSIQVIMLTSSVPNEGKSDIAMSLAQSFAQIGKKTIVLDADIRQSILATRYQLGLEVRGLSQYLSGQRSLDEIAYKTSSEHLDIIFAGPYSPNPAELLEEKLFREMLDMLRKEYDHIIIDTPPMSNIIDGAIVARSCDGVIMVIEDNAISYRLGQKVKNQLEKTGCRILGAVLNKVDLEEKRYYGRYGKYKKYE